MDFTNVTRALEERGFAVSAFETAAEAAAYLDRVIDGVSVSFGGSMTLQEMGLFDKLAPHNELLWHWAPPPEGMTVADVRARAATTDVFLTSANGLAETGEIINIDGSGNRVASTLYGHKKVYFVIGRNKLAPTYEKALWRARNIAAPKNAQRLGMKTPCAVKGDRCYDCRSENRICRGLVVLWEPMLGVETEIVLVNEELGY